MLRDPAEIIDGGVPFGLTRDPHAKLSQPNGWATGVVVARRGEHTIRRTIQFGEQGELVKQVVPDKGLAGAKGLNPELTEVGTDDTSILTGRCSIRALTLTLKQRMRVWRTSHTEPA